MNTLLLTIVLGGSSSGLVAILIHLLILVLVLGLIYWIITLLPLPPLVLRIAQIVLAIVVIIWLASLVACTPTGPYHQNDDPPPHPTPLGQAHPH